MKLVLKMVALAFVLALVFIASFLVWGEQLETLFSHERCTAWFTSVRPYAWLIAIGLLVSDLLLPVPATGVMTALGAVYGTWLGGLIAAVGSMLAGWTGYGLARWGGERAVRWFTTPEELQRFHEFFDRWGGYAIIGSRMTPVLPEVFTLLAGLARMELRRFAVALALGSTGTGFLFAYLGQLTREQPRLGVFLSLAVPLVLYVIIVHVLWARKRS